MLRPITRAYRRLPTGVRYSLRPLGALDELGSFLPPRARLAIQGSAEGARTVVAARRACTPLIRLTGRSAIDGGPLAVATNLTGEGLAYWSGLLFAGTPQIEILGELRGAHGVGRVDPAALRVDLVIVRHHRWARRVARRAGFVIVPTWVQVFATIDRPLDALVTGTRSGRNARKNDVRRVVRAGLTARIGRGAEVGRFLRDYHLPFLARKFGDTGVHLPEAWIRQAPRFCDVLWIEHAGAPIGGMLLERRGRTIRMVAGGAATALEGEIAAALPEAIYYFTLAEAVARGLAGVRLGGARPVLSDGVLAVKHKWGGRLGAVRQWDFLGVAVPRWTPTVRALLRAHPLIAMEGTDFLVLSDPAVRTDPASPWRRMRRVGIRALLGPGNDGGWERIPLADDEG